MRMSRSTSNRAHPWLPAVVIALVAGAGSISCGPKNNPEPSPGPDFEGTIVVLFGRSPLAGEGQLRSVRRNDAGARVLSNDVVLSSLQDVAPRGRTLPFSRSGSDTDVIDIVDIDTGATRQFASGRGPVASSDRVAFCAQHGQLTVAPVDGSNGGRAVATVPAGCVHAVWHNNTLAFLTLGTSTNQAGATVHIWDGGDLQEFEAPVGVHGYGPVTWSAQGTSLMYSNGEKVVEIDLGAKRAAILGDGKAPKYSPVTNDLYAVVTDQSAIEVRSHNGGTIATRGFAGSTLPWAIDFAWSPDGKTIAVVTPTCLNVWRWDSGEASCIAESGASGGYLPIALWFP